MLLPTTFPVTCHTNRIGKNSTFVAIKGFSSNGITFIPQALEQGASRIIVHLDDYSKELELLCCSYGASLETVNNTRQALALEAAHALNFPAKKLKIIAITGTKGKTSTSYLTEHLLRQAGYKTALVGSIVNRILTESDESSHATPSSDYLQMFFAACVSRGVEYVVLEVSSHAIDLDRIYGISCESVAFLNLMPDHLDYHQSMEEYFAVKSKIFSYVKQGGTIVVNLDHQWGAAAYHNALLQKEISGAQIIPLSASSTSHDSAQIESIKSTLSGVLCSVRYHNQSLSLETSKLFGTFNAYNMSVAALIALQQGIAPTDIARALKTFPGVPGRLQHHQLKNGAHAFVDYAHNGGSAQEVLQALRPHTQQLIAVFGCGGDKDPGRRPGMGLAAARFADIIILTNDNPRSEDPSAIIDDIMAGIPEAKRASVRCELDRHKAIALAASIAQPNAIIALLGKGHQKTIISKGSIIHCDDFETISAW